MAQEAPLIFHKYYGCDVLVSNNHTKASRIEDNSSGLTFTSTPIQPGQKIYLRILKTSEKSHGILSIGFTTNNPSAINTRAESKHRDLKKEHGFWLGSLSKHACTKESVLFFYASPNGRIHYGFDGTEKGHFDRKVDVGAKFWGVVNIWNAQTTIELVNCNGLSHQIRSSHKYSPLMLHQKHGRNAIVAKNRAWRHRKDDRKASCVFTERPLEIGERVVVKILSVDLDSEGCLCVGFTNCNPVRLKSREIEPSEFLDRKEYWVVIDDLHSFVTADELSFFISRNGELGLWKNGSSLLKMIHVDQNLKLWAFFDVKGTTREIQVVSCKAYVEDKRVLPSAPAAEEDGANQNGGNQDGANQDGADCSVCYENVVDAALYPCGHMCMCYDCARKQWMGETKQCPLCRAVIKDVLRIYKS